MKIHGIAWTACQRGVHFQQEDLLERRPAWTRMQLQADAMDFFMKAGNRWIAP